MTMTVTLLVLLAAFVAAIASALGRAPLYVAVLLLAIAGLLRELPR
jgi:hypothetical protein